MNMKAFFLNAGRNIKTIYSGRYAILVNTATAGSMSCLGDAVCQYLEKIRTQKEFSIDRNWNMSLIGFGFGPLDHFWYALLDRKFPGASFKAVKTKVLLEIVFLIPYNICYILGISLLRGYSYDRSVEEVKNKLPILLSVDTISWSFMQALNFAFAPAYLRVLVMKVNEFLLSAIDSHIINNEYEIDAVLLMIKRSTLENKDKCPTNHELNKQLKTETLENKTY